MLEHCTSDFIANNVIIVSDIGDKTSDKSTPTLICQFSITYKKKKTLFYQMYNEQRL